MAPTRSRWVACLGVAGVATLASIMSAVPSRKTEGSAFTPTTTTLVSSVNPSAVGQLVTFTATVTAIQGGMPVVPTGNVSFLDGVTNLGTVPLSAGVATLSTSLLAAGPHNITAAYSGAFAASNSPVLVQTVGAASVGPVPTLGAFGLLLLALALG